MRKRRIACAVLMLSCLTSCEFSPSIGPKIKTEYIISNPGHPARVVENIKVKVIPEGASEPVEQDIGAWVTMPQEHFDALMRALDAKKP